RDSPMYVGRVRAGHPAQGRVSRGLSRIEDASESAARTAAQSALHAQGRVVFRFVQQELDAAGEDDSRDDAEAHVSRLVEDLDTLRTQLGDGRTDITAHQRHL